MRRLDLERAVLDAVLPRLWPLVVATAVALAFWIPAARGTGGHFPIPLDDTYIYFDFARSTAQGHFLAWVPGNGLSSGATSPLYALVLAVGWLVGFRGDALGTFAAIVAIVSIADASTSLARMMRPALRWTAPVLLLSVPVLTFAAFSGMETGLFAAVALRAVRAAHRALTTLPEPRKRAQMALGGWCAAMVVARPESLGLSLALGFVVTYRAGSLSTLASLARAVVPPVATLLLQAAVFRATTGETAAAGAIRKLWTYSPYLAPRDVVLAWAKNALRLAVEGVYVPFGPLGLAALAFLVVGALRHATRLVGAAVIAGAACSFVVVCLNATAPFQNYRYLAPVHLAAIVIVAFGASSWSGPLVGRVRARGLGAAGIVAATVFVAVALQRFPVERDRFAAASRNIAEQQVVVGERLRAMRPPPRRVFVGDAGAIPYFAETGALDGLGLGGYRNLPFARASTHGTPAVIELVERLAPEERPDVLAIYDSWWPGVGERFGELLFSVRIDDNVICADPEKRVYRARWGLLERRDEPASDRLDVADIVDERAHAYEMPRPHGGYLVERVLREGAAPRYDAGRIVAEGRAERFVLESTTPGRHRLRLRTDDGPSARLRITFRVEGGTTESVEATTPRADGQWSYLEVAAPGAGRGPEENVRKARLEVEIAPIVGELRSYAYWLVQ